MQRHRGPFELIFKLSRMVGNLTVWHRAAVVGAVLGLLSLGATALSAETVTFTVDDKSVWRFGSLMRLLEPEHSRRAPRSTGVLVIETPSEVFEVNWSFVYWKFDKYERWNSLQPGETYSAVVTGWRVPFFGQYRNIVEVFAAQGVEG